ncbi:MAG: hypothetical protein QFX35_02535 [Candidatus Verstraetearchaeota archaeon]|nr:hypothetical protein [Candidatus Verstraetearchaeota archaeon]
MGSIDCLYDRIKRYLSGFFIGKGLTDALTGYSSGELQIAVFLMVLAALFRVLMVPLGIMLLLGVAVLLYNFAPIIRVVDRENSNDLNRVLFWVVVYLSIIVAVTLWG